MIYLRKNPQLIRRLRMIFCFWSFRESMVFFVANIHNIYAFVIFYFVLSIYQNHFSWLFSKTHFLPRKFKLPLCADADIFMLLFALARIDTMHCNVCKKKNMFNAINLQHGLCIIMKLKPYSMPTRARILTIYSMMQWIHLPVALQMQL